MSSVQFINGKKKTRGELRLPQLHFIACDDWMKKIGKTAFCAWLEFYTWADRTYRKSDRDIIASSMNAVAKKLEISKTTLYEKIIKPLWNYGFIDLQEIEINGTICTNIIVYEYPKNDPDLSTKELIQVRDYDKDYTSLARKKSLKNAKTRRGKEGGQSKKSTTPSPKRVLPPVQKEYQGSTEIGRNNVSNPFNVLNPLNEKNIYQSDILPNTVLTSLKEYSKLMDRLTDLESVYELVKSNKGYSDVLFVLTCISASKQIGKLHIGFKEYLQKSMLNNMKQQSMEEPKLKGSQVIQDKLPESVQRQLKREQKGEGKPATKEKRTIMDDPELKALFEDLRSDKERRQ